MKTSADGVEAIRNRESMSLVIYDDAAGLATIGVGHLITAAEKESGIFDGGITEIEAHVILIADLAPAEDAVNAFVGVLLTQEQFDSLVSFVFNVGASAFQKSSLLRALNATAPSAEIVADFMKWDKIHDRKTGQPVAVPGLAKRRAEEARPWRIDLC